MLQMQNYFKMECTGSDNIHEQQKVSITFWLYDLATYK